MMFRLIFMVLFWVLHTVTAQTPVEVLDRLQDKYESIDDFSSDFKQILGNDGKAVLSGKFFYKKKDKFRLLLTNQIIVSDGVTIWNFDKRLGRVVINLLENDPSSFSISQIIYDLPAKCKLGLAARGENKNDVLVLTPESDDMGFSMIKLTISGEGLIKRMDILDAMGNNYVFELENIEINTGMKESLFEFFPPEGTNIIDLR